MATTISRSCRRGCPSARRTRSANTSPNPPDFSKLEADERLPDQSLSDEPEVADRPGNGSQPGGSRPGEFIGPWSWPDWQRQRGFSQISGTSSGPNVEFFGSHATPQRAQTKKQVPQTKPMITTQQIAELVGGPRNKPRLLRQMFATGERGSGMAAGKRPRQTTPPG